MTDDASNAQDRSPAPAAHDSSFAARHSSFLSWIGAAGIVTIAAMRCAIAFLPQTTFEIDPASERDVVIAALGPAGSMLLDALLALACAIALIGEWQRRKEADGGLDPLLLGLALLALPMIWWHGSADGGDLWRGSTWLAGAVACVTIAHLARRRIMRIALTACLVAVIVPLLARGATQITYEHDATVAQYRASKAEFLAQRGWTEDSPAARIFERRLMHREPTGWFTTTNIYGSLAGCCALVFIGAAIAAMRARMQSGWWFLMLLLAGSCAAALWLTGSMGALLATAAGGGVLALAGWAANRADRRSMRWLGAAVSALMVAALLGVVVRGAILPEGFAGERSLLFRWHYLQASSAIIAAHPLTGVGPDGFQEAYTAQRPPRNPEEVQSAHSMFVDWLAALGVLAAGWVAMVFVLACRAPPSAADSTGGEGAARPALRMAMAVALLGLIPAALIEWRVLLGQDIFVRILAAAGSVAVAAMLATALSAAGERWLRGMIAAAAAMLLVHGQIEMTFAQSGSCAWALAMVGLLGSARAPRTGRILQAFSLVVVMLAIGAWLIWLTISGVVPALAQERMMIDAAGALEPLRHEPHNEEVALTLRPRVADSLVRAYERWPANVLPLNAAAEQLLIAARRPDGGVALGLLWRAGEIIDRAIVEHRKPNSIVQGVFIHAALAQATGEIDEWTQAIALARHMAEGDPHGVGAWQRLGDVLWLARQRAQAAEAYRRALANSDNFVLDELKQLTPRVREQIERRLSEISSDSTSADTQP